MDIANRQLHRTTSNTRSRRLSQRVSQRSISQRTSQRNLGQRISQRSFQTSALDVSAPSNRMSHNLEHKDLTAHLRQARMSTVSKKEDRVKDIIAEEDQSKRVSNMTTYSLPPEFVDNALSPMNPTNRRKTKVVCKSNQDTLQMANQIVVTGAITVPPSEDDSDDDGIACLCFTCARI